MKLKYLIAFLSLLSISCSEENDIDLIWEKELPRIGSQSSPLVTDLNGDDILDIVFGAGENEFDNSNQGVIALDGSSGEIIWQAPSKDQVFGSPTFNDINSDGIQDVIIGGRSCQLYGLNGANGEKIWDFNPKKYAEHPKLKYANKNFYNSVLVPDCNGDGIKDILISNGGNPEVFPFVKKGREVGVLLLLDSKSGDVIAADTVPDGQETYMTPIYVEQEDGSNMILFGTGGETFSGSLYVTSLEDLLKNDISQAKVLATERNHGFISPPVFVDLTNDNVFDIVAVSHAGSMTAIDGSNLEGIWDYKIPYTESSNGFAIGNFNGDETPDVFTFVSKGQWPWNNVLYQVMLNGRTGELEYLDSIGCPSLSSPVVYDLNNDQIDEVIISLNLFECRGFADGAPDSMKTELIAINFKDNEIIHLDRSENVKNIFTTPILADIDNDGFLDITHAEYSHSENLDILFFSGMKVKRTETKTKLTKAIEWGAYMGSKGDGVYR